VREFEEKAVDNRVKIESLLVAYAFRLVYQLTVLPQAVD
jgi:hypothetical protein